MLKFSHKGWGRIYVSDELKIARVKQIIREMDNFECEYLPKDMIAPFSEYPIICYTHKFDALNLDTLTARCWKEGIYIFCVDNGKNEYLDTKHVNWHEPSKVDIF